MAIYNQGEPQYSPTELSRILKITENEVVELLKTQKVGTRDFGNVMQISRNNLDELFHTFRSSRGITDTYYKLPRWLELSLEPWAVTLTRLYRQSVAFPLSLSPAQGELLRTLIINIAPTAVVEIGSFIGVSTLWIASGLQQIDSTARVHAIDKFDDMFPYPPHHYHYVRDYIQLVQDAIYESQLSEYITLHKGDSRQIAKKMDRLIDRKVDFIYIDGDHTIPGSTADFLYFYPYVSDGGYIILHDIYPEHCGWTGPRYVIDRFIRGSKHFELLEMTTSPLNYGMALIRKLGVDQGLIHLAARFSSQHLHFGSGQETE